VKRKILCIDDEVEIARALTRVLSRDFDVVTAATVAEAKSKLSPDLAVVLSDLRLPDGSGFDVLAKAQDICPEAVRAILTAHIEFNELIDAINRQLVHRLILKPWDNDYLRLQMIEALHSHDTLLQKRELERLAITDPVTLLRNHRFFQDQLKVELARANRHGRELSLLMVDIDHFKTFNDTYGHPAGDRLLRDVGKRLTDAVRNLDTVARYGGEEFAILLPDTPLDHALIVAERVRRSFSEAPFDVAGSGSTLVTISLGIANAPLHTTTPASLVEVADRALYCAKGQGRNQWVVGIAERP
jgi:diguanylate cyclase (GGDEF)-like protein